MHRDLEAKQRDEEPLSTQEAFDLQNLKNQIQNGLPLDENHLGFNYLKPE